MTKQEILDKFNDIDFVYNDSSKHETLSRMLDELLKEQEAVIRCKDCINCVKEPNGELYCDILAVGYEPLGSKKVRKDWFCADGKYKENSNEQP